MMNSPSPAAAIHNATKLSRRHLFRRPRSPDPVEAPAPAARYGLAEKPTAVHVLSAEQSYAARQVADHGLQAVVRHTHRLDQSNLPSPSRAPPFLNSRLLVKDMSPRTGSSRSVIVIPPPNTSRRHQRRHRSNSLPAACAQRKPSSTMRQLHRFFE